MSDALNDALLQLHAGCRLKTVAEFKSWALDLAASVVPFRHAHWGSAALVDGGILSLGAYMRGLDPDYERRFNASVHLDPRSMEIVASGGRTFLRDGNDPLDCPVEYRRAVMDPAGICYGAVTAIVDGRNGLMEGLAFMREEREGRFSEDERQLVQSMAPHLSQARIANLIERAQDVLDAGLGASYFTMVASHDGVVTAVQSGATDLIVEEWPGWTGARLPKPLAEAVTRCATAGRPALWRGKRMVARLHPSATQVLMRTRAPNIVDTLGERELTVAERYADGASYKEIARALKLSPSTVSNQLASVYSKLGVSNKSELIRQLDSWR